LDTIRNLLYTLFEGFWSAVGTMVQRLANDPSYRQGFVAGCLTLIGVLVLAGLFNYAWARVNKFFSATKGPPAPSAGTKPIKAAGSCLWGTIILLLLAGLGLALLSSLVAR